MEQIQRTIELEFTILDFYDDFVVSRIREGVVFSKEQVRDLIEVCSNFFEGREFVYISQRVTNYNVDPTIYLNLDLVDNLAGIAIVSSKTSSLMMAGFEQNFSKVPYGIFLDLEEALEWKNDVIKNKKAGL